MNKAITDGVVLMPPKFDAGLTVWARGDGTPGSDTYHGTVSAAFVPADLDFGGCLEIQKTQSTQKLRYMGETPLLPGCYLRITARVKAMSGPMPSVRIAGWAGGAGSAHVSGLTEVGVTQSLTSYGDVVEVSAIVGPGRRTGVDMAWGRAALYGHFGLDLTGPLGGVVRIDDIQIEDITSVFHRDMMNIVDVRDFGAIGDGSTDDHAAFVAADAAAAGRTIFVPKGTFRIGNSLTLTERVSFEGKLSMADGHILSLVKDFDLPKYIDAFGGDEELGFRKAFQSLLNNADHESLDLGGRRISISEPLDLQAIEGSRNSFAQRRVIRNGQFYVTDSAAWNSEAVTSSATYSASRDDRLTRVSNAANIKVGSQVIGTGVGREVYVREVNVGAKEVRLSAPLHDAEGRQTYTFRRYKYVFDFSGFDQISQLVLTDIEFLCRGYASGIMLAKSGVANMIKDCVINRPKDRGITSIGTGCQGLFIDSCQFITNEGGVRSSSRSSVAINLNGNDVKLRDNRASQFRHFAVMGGQNYLISGNHMFQGDSVANGTRHGGLVFTRTNVNHSVIGNYIDNCYIEWTNEGTADPSYPSGFSFSALNITGNVFLCTDVSSSFSFIVIKPFGANQRLRGLSVTDNTFRSLKGSIDRVERVNKAIADLNMESAKDVLFSGNSFANIEHPVDNPVTEIFTQGSANDTWSVSFSQKLAFHGKAKRVTAVTALDRIRNSGGATQYIAPYALTERGAAENVVQLEWGQPVRGKVSVTARMDS